MLNSQPLSLLPKEVLDYLRACQYFLAFAAERNACFSREEQDVIEYYTAEVTKTLVSPHK